MREQFEKLPEINNRLSQGGIYWNGNKYDTLPFMSHFVSTAIFLNGAWYAYQEQQKKIDAIRSKLSDIYDASDECETVAHLLDEIQEILK